MSSFISPKSFGAAPYIAGVRFVIRISYLSGALDQTKASPNLGDCLVQHALCVLDVECCLVTGLTRQLFPMEG
ncbi:hypothetical protein F3P66_08400 [Agrobacterium fabrum]|uniref:Uncharacterized protein n=1 Tax=Agrobacterium fabrum (strain C58 / ATCC 33970) TaxID=176299 RepID=Q8UG56_AGRFC|nr:hypothetical protein Atu1185 [Agrobacterium fabrum str. C58]QRM59467.1 hypothetical protein F3P66_08400 [Agrobacterium fabrum]TRB30888.1 hypothetical protein EXN51_01540 [Agrobacterium fabrum]